MRHMDEGLLQAWLDGPRAGLREEERAAIDDHLGRCGECAARVDALRDSTARVGDLLGPVDGEDVPDFEAVEGRARTLGARSRRRRLWVAAGWAASVVVALGVGWLSNELTRESAGAAAGAGAEGVADASRPVEEGGVVRPAAPIEAEATPAAGEIDALDETDVAAVDAQPDPEASTETGEAAVVAAADARAQAMPDEPEGERAVPAASEPPVVVRGRVTEAGTDRPVQGVQVYAEGTNDGTITGPDGTFRLALGSRPDSALESVTLVATLIGYGSERQRVGLVAGDTASRNFQLSSEAIALDEIVVTGFAAARAGSAGDSETDAVPLRVPSFEDDPDAWRAVSRSEADSLVAFPTRTVPGLAVLGFHVATVEDVPVVRVVQELGDGVRLTLVQASRDVELGSHPGVARASMTLDDGVFVLGRAPLPEDSVRALLSRVR